MIRRVGLVGGLGPEATIDYYRRVIEAWKRADPASLPPMVIDSLDFNVGLRLVQSDRPALVDYLADSVARLARAGVEFVAMTANTAHVVFDEVAARAPVPLLSIVETCAAEAERRGLRRLALLGTRFTMEGTFYPQVFARRGLTVVAPAPDERTYVHDRYLGELIPGVFRDDTRDAFVRIIRDMRGREGVDGVVLGGTEIPLLLTGGSVDGLPLLDTTQIHVDAIVARLRGA